MSLRRPGTKPGPLVGSDPSAVRTRKRDTAALAVGSAVSGILAYVVFAITTRTLGPVEAAPVTVLWTYWSFSSAALTFPLQHWIASTVALHGEGAVRRTLPRLSLVVAATSVAIAALAWVGREQLFNREDIWFPAMVALVTVGSALVGVARGGLTAQERFASVGWSFVAENGVRCVAAGALALAGSDSAVAYGLCLLAGHLTAFVWPAAMVFAREHTATVASRALAFLSGSGLAQILAQIVLTGGPVLLALGGGTPGEVTALFAALALFRAPYILALGLVSQLTGIVTRLMSRGDEVAIRRIRVRILGATTALAALTGLLGLLLGPAVMRLVFGERLEFPAAEAAIVGIACIVAVGNLVSSVTLMARNRPRATVRAWLVGLAGGMLAFVALWTVEPVGRTSWTFLVIEVVAFVVLVRSGRADLTTA